MVEGNMCAVMSDVSYVLIAAHLYSTYIPIFVHYPCEAEMIDSFNSLKYSLIAFQNHYKTMW